MDLDWENITEPDEMRSVVDLLGRAGAAAGQGRIAFVLTRLRQDPTEPIRDDEERRLSRLLEVPTRLAFGVGGQVRLSARASDATLTALVRPPSAVDLHDASGERRRACLDGPR